MNTFELMDFILDATSETIINSEMTENIFLSTSKNPTKIYFSVMLIAAIVLDNDIFQMHLYKRINGKLSQLVILNGYKWSDIKQNKGNKEYLISNPDMKYLFDDMWSDDLKKEIEELVTKLEQLVAEGE